MAAGGSKSWVLRYSIDGRKREMGLGSFEDFGVADARERAKKVRVLLADGIDPIEHRRQQRIERLAEAKAAAVQARTFEECARQFHKSQENEWRNAKHAAQWINTLQSYVFPKYGALPLAEFDKAAVVQALSPIWKSKAETAGRVLQRIRTVLNYAAAKDYCPGKDVEFWAQVKLALGKNDRARKVEHHPSCPHADVGALLSTIEASTATSMVKLAFKFIVLTAARSGEVRGATWSELDDDLTTWTVPGERMKAGREHRVPISERAQQILTEAKALQIEHGWTDEGNPQGLVFPTPGGKPYSDMVFTQLMRRLSLPFTMHGFRSSFRTWGQEETDYPHEMLEMALAHSVGDQTVRAYARSDMAAKRRQLMADWARHIEHPQS
ncbi:MAG: tyrosine-type recombinase/integrase [Rhodospirillales bacterium]|nr:tyrosine-type recombinase/integrase [Acetobacter sp.]